MEKNLSLAQLVDAITAAHKADNEVEAERLFLELYDRIRDHFYRAYRSVLAQAFGIFDVSPLAERVYQDILSEIDRDIRKGKFKVDPAASDEVVRKRLATRVLRKAYWRMCTALGRVEHKVTVRAGDLAPDSFEQIAELPDTDEEEAEAISARVKLVFGQLSLKDADVLKTRYCTALNKLAAEAELMDRYGWSGSACKKALYRAKERFRKLWLEAISREHRQFTHTSTQKPKINELRAQT